MKKKEIFMNHATRLKGEYVMTEPSSMAAMEEYAQHQLKNLNTDNCKKVLDLIYTSIIS